MKKKLNIVRNAMNSIKADMAAQLVRKAWDVLTESCSLGSLRVVVQPYQCINPAETQYCVPSQRSDGFESLNQEHTLFEVESLLQTPEEADATARNQTAGIDKAIQFLSCS